MNIYSDRWAISILFSFIVTNLYLIWKITHSNLKWTFKTSNFLVKKKTTKYGVATYNWKSSNNCSEIRYDSNYDLNIHVNNNLSLLLRITEKSLFDYYTIIISCSQNFWTQFLVLHRISGQIYSTIFSVVQKEWTTHD